MKVSYRKAYEIGKKAHDAGIAYEIDAIRNFGQDVNVDHWNFAALQFFMAGLEGCEMPYEVTGWRYGKVPGECSRNYKDDRQEAGVSVMAVDGGDETVDKISAMFIAAGRSVVRVRGYLNTRKRGSDGEPLLLDAVEIE